MARLILPRSELKRLIRRRRAWGADHHDEVWSGVYVMSPDPDNEHQDLGSRLTHAFWQAVGESPARIFHGCNISDSDEKWERNYRVPDVAIFLPGNAAEDRKTHWRGGPDLAVEIASPGDRSRKKFNFYARVGVRELLIVDRTPAWKLERYRLSDGRLVSAGTCGVDDGRSLASDVLPVRFRLVAGPERPRLEITTTDGTRTWLA